MIASFRRIPREIFFCTALFGALAMLASFGPAPAKDRYTVVLPGGEAIGCTEVVPCLGGGATLLGCGDDDVPLECVPVLALREERKAH